MKISIAAYGCSTPYPNFGNTDLFKVRFKTEKIQARGNLTIANRVRRLLSQVYYIIIVGEKSHSEYMYRFYIYK